MMAEPGGEHHGATNLIFRNVSNSPAPFSHVFPLRLHACPVLLLAVCFAAGIVFARSHWQPPADVLLAVTCFLLLAAVARMYAPRVAWLAVGILFASLGWSAALLQPSLQDDSLRLYADGLQRTVEARVVKTRMLPAVVASSPEHATLATDTRVEETPSMPPREVLEVEVLRMEQVTPDASTMMAAHGGMFLTLASRSAADFAPVPCGSHITFHARLRQPSRYFDPGVWNYADQLSTRGIAVDASADPATLHMLESIGAPLACRFATVQAWSSRRLHALVTFAPLRQLPTLMRLSQTDADVLSAMLFGDRTAITRNLRASFERTGTFHLFVVAGIHIALVLAGVYTLLLKLRVPRPPAAACAIFIAAAFALMTGFGEPVQRALLMSSMYLLATLFGRERHALNALGAAALVMLLIDPHALFEAGFQMTVLSVVAIGGIAAPLAGRTFRPAVDALRNIRRTRHDVALQPAMAQLRISARLLARALTGAKTSGGMSLMQCVPAWLMRAFFVLLELALITAVAEWVIALPMAIYFHRLTPFAAPANLIALPLLALLMCSALATFALSLLHRWLALLPSILTACLLHIVSAIVELFSGLHGADVRIPAPPLMLSLAAVFLCMIALWLVRRHARRWGYAAAAVAAIAFLSLLVPLPPRLHPGGLEVTAIDVGQGDSLFLATPAGATVLVDAGGPIGSNASLTTNTFDIGEEVVSPYLWSRGLRRLDVLAITHAHSDHIGGALAVFRNFRPRELWLSIDADSPELNALISEATASGSTIRHLHSGDTVAMGGTEFLALSPPRDRAAGGLPANDDSLVLRVRYGKASALLAGDAEGASEAAMESAGLQPVTLLKVGHHGSNTSTSQQFVASLHPQAAVISAGRGNPFGHPRMPVLQRLQSMGVLTSRTDTMGAVSYFLHADGSMESTVRGLNP